MSWLNRYHMIWRIVLMVALVVASTGPWVYDLDGVPPAEYCHYPLIFLSSGRCARQVPVLEMMGRYMGRLPVEFALQIARGEYILERTGEFMMGFLFPLFMLLFLLPLLSTSLSIWRMGSVPLRRFYRLTWSLPGLICLLMVSLDRELRLPLFWGVWAFLAIAVVALLLDVLSTLSFGDIGWRQVNRVAR